MMGAQSATEKRTPLCKAGFEVEGRGAHGDEVCPVRGYNYPTSHSQSVTHITNCGKIYFASTIVVFSIPCAILSTCWQTGGKIMDTGFKFQVRWDGRAVAGVTKVSALKRSTEVVEYREGADPSTSRKLPGLTKFQPIVLARGVTRDPEFQSWAQRVYSPQAGPLQKDFRKDIEIELL